MIHSARSFFRIGDIVKYETVWRGGGTRFSSVLRSQNMGETFWLSLSVTYLYEGADNSSDHSVEKAVSCDLKPPIPEAIFRDPEGSFHDADTVLCGRLSEAKRTKMMLA